YAFAASPMTLASASSPRSSRSWPRRTRPSKLHRRPGSAAAPFSEPIASTCALPSSRTTLVWCRPSRYATSDSRWRNNAGSASCAADSPPRLSICRWLTTGSRAPDLQSVARAQEADRIEYTPAGGDGNAAEFFVPDKDEDDIRLLDGVFGRNH